MAANQQPTILLVIEVRSVLVERAVEQKSKLMDGREPRGSGVSSFAQARGHHPPANHQHALPAPITKG